MTLRSLSQKVRIESQYGAAKLPWDRQDDWQREAHNYRVRLRYGRRQMSLDFWMGPANGSEPTAEGVLNCILSDATVSTDFAEFCSELGYDQDSRKAERIHRACLKLGQKVRRLLGSDFDSFVYAER